MATVADQRPAETLPSQLDKPSVDAPNPQLRQGLCRFAAKIGVARVREFRQLRQAADLTEFTP